MAVGSFGSVIGLSGFVGPAYGLMAIALTMSLIVRLKSGRIPQYLVVPAFALATFGIFFYFRWGAPPEFMVMFSLLVLGALLPKTQNLVRGFGSGVLLCCALYLAGLVLSIDLLSANGRVTAFHSNPIWAAWLVGAGTIYAAFTLKRKSRYIVVCALLAALAYSGSRSPAAAVLLAVFIATPGLSRKARAVLIVLPMVYLFASFTPQARALTWDFQDASQSVRFIMWAQTWDEISAHPSGYGADQWHFLHFTYPHNLFLEFAHAYGIWLASALIGLIGFAFANVASWKSDQRNALLALFVFGLITSLTSGSLDSHRTLYFLVGFTLSLRPRWWVRLRGDRKNKPRFQHHRY